MKSELYIVAIYLNAFGGESKNFSLHKITKVTALRQLVCALHTAVFPSNGRFIYSSHYCSLKIYKNSGLDGVRSIINVGHGA